MLIGIYLQQPQYAVGSRLNKTQSKNDFGGGSPLRNQKTNRAMLGII